MKGTTVRKILISKGYLLKDVAAKLGMTQPNFSQIMSSKDVKSGTLERICDVLNVKMDFFYEDTPYAPEIRNQESEIDYTSFDKDSEVIFLKGQIKALKEANQALIDKILNYTSENLNIKSDV